MPASVTLDTDLELTTYAGGVVHDFILGNAFTSGMMIHYDMRDSENLDLPIVLHDDAEYLDDDRDHTETHGEFTASLIPLKTPLKASNRVKKRSVQERPGLRHLENLGKSHGKSIAKGKTLGCMISLAQDADRFGNEVDINGISGSTDPDRIKNAIKETVANLDELEVPAEGRFGMLKSTAFYELADQDGVMSVDFGSGGANRATVGGNFSVVRYLDVDWINVGIGFGTNFDVSTSYPTYAAEDLDFDMSDSVGLCWQSDCWAIREQVMPETGIDWIGRLQVWQTLTRYQWGYKAVTNDDGSSAADGPGQRGIWAINDTRSAGAF